MGCFLWHFCQLSDSESGRDFSSCSPVSPLFRCPPYSCTTFSCLPCLQPMSLEPFWGSLLVKADLPSVQPSCVSQALFSQSRHSNPVCLLLPLNPLTAIDQSQFTVAQLSSHIHFLLLYSLFYIFRSSQCDLRGRKVNVRASAAPLTQQHFECYLLFKYLGFCPPPPIFWFLKKFYRHFSRFKYLIGTFPLYFNRFC